MFEIRRVAALSTVLLLVLLAGCAADPAADAPQAQVSEPAPTTDAMDDAESASIGATATYAIAPPDSKIEFVGSKVTGSHDGGFEKFEGKIVVVDQDPTRSEVSVMIDTTSLWSDNERLTGHLKSDDFFGVETYPTATFESTGITDNGDGTYTVTGNLDLHGVTKTISFPAEIEVDEDSVSATAEFAIKRFDFGIEYKGKADDLIRDDVLIKLDLHSGHDDGDMA